MTRRLRIVHRAQLARFGLEGWLGATFGTRPRIAATATWYFPIYSQAFVYQEVLALAAGGFDAAFFYSQPVAPSGLAASCAGLWRRRRRVWLHRETARLDLEHYRRRMPERVARLTDRLSAAAGLTRQQLEDHEHFLQAFSFARVVEAWRADYLHSYFFYERSLFAMIAADLLDLPRGVSCYADHMLRDYPLKLVPMHLQSCDVIVATSRRILGELEALHGGPLPSAVVKPNAIATGALAVRRSPRRPGVPLRLLSVSRLDRKKGLEYLVDAAGLLRSRGHAVEARVLGGADAHRPDSLAYAGELREQTARLGLDRIVRFLGPKDSAEVRAAFEWADVFVAPSVDLASGDKDGIPTAVLEAMAAGCAIVASRGGSIAEVIDDGREGLLVPQRDAAALAEAIERLGADVALSARLGAAAVARARAEFDVASSEAAFHDRIRDAIAHRRAAAAGRGA